MTRNHAFRTFESAFVLALVFVCVVFMQTANAQTTIHVPADQATIQAAITAAQPGDTVLVAPGTYLENIDFQGKAIRVTSSDGAGVTIVDGGGAGPVVTFKSSEGAGSVLNGLTLRNGSPSHTFPGTGTSGAGIWIYFSSPTITSNVITGNHAICGIGMEVQGGSAVIRGNTITGNTQAGGTGGCGGGGIEVTGDSSHPTATPLITGNTITNNSLQGGGNGGGINVGFNASPTIQNNFISGNAVWNSGGGILIQANSGTPTVVVQNIIVNNSTAGGGSGGGIAASSRATLTANTIAGNTAFDGSSGIFADRFGPITISNNLVVAALGQTGIVCSQFSSTFPTFSHNDVTSPGGGQIYSSNCAAAAQGNGNISLDPQFVNSANGDYHLQATSPAIDAGDNGAPNLPQQDYNGNPRVVDGNNDCTDTADMGAYEVQSSVQGSFSPASLAFANQVLNTTSNAQPVTLSAAGNSCLKVSLAVTGDFAQSNTCGAGVPAGQSCVVNVTFTPTATGTRTGVLSLNGNAASVSLSGTGIAPATASVSPSSISFGDVVVGTESQAQIVTVSNTGGSTLHINSLLVSGDPDFFTLTNNCVGGPGVAPGGTCSAQVVFFPHSAGAGSATLTIGSDAINNPVSVSISGTGVNPPVASVSPSSISFGNVVIGTESQVQIVTVSNTGGSTLHINSLLVSGDPDFFTLTNNCVGGPGVAPGGTCSAQVVFFPHSAGAGSATLTIGSDAINGPVSVSLSGTGVDFALSASPSSLSVRSGHQVQTTITVSAVGGSFNNAVGLGCSGLPRGAVCSFSPASVTPGATSSSSTLTIGTQSGGTRTPRGTYSITINGSSNGVLHSTVITLTVTGN
jgi:hypothetical protein